MLEWATAMADTGRPGLRPGESDEVRVYTPRQTMLTIKTRSPSTGVNTKTVIIGGEVTGDLTSAASSAH